MRLATAWFGCVLFDGDRPVRQALFPADAAAVAERLARMQDGEVLDEERGLAPAEPFEVHESRLLKLPGARLAPEPRPRLPARAGEFGASRALLHEASLALGRRRYREEAGGADQHVLMAVDAVDDLAEVANALSERLREWYGLHYPELQVVPRHEEFVALVGQHGTRQGIQAARPDLPAESMGADVSPAEAEAVRRFARLASSVYSTRADLEKYLEEAMPRLAPNVTHLLGASLAARIVRLAGGLDALARMPSGTIQTLGAEKALFRHLREGKRPPKHGVILQHPTLHRAPRPHRGALARALAGKVALAARADAFTKADIGAKLAADFEARADTVRRERAVDRRPRDRAPPRRRPRAVARRPRDRAPPRGGPRGPPREPYGRGPPGGRGGGPPGARGGGGRGPPGRGPPGGRGGRDRRDRR